MQWLFIFGQRLWLDRVSSSAQEVDPHLVLDVHPRIRTHQDDWWKYDHHGQADMGVNPRWKGGLSSIKRTPDWRAHGNERPWSSNNLININDEQQSAIRQSGLWRVHLQSRLSDQNSLIMNMDQADRFININCWVYVTDHDGKQGHSLTHNSCLFIWVVNSVISHHCTYTAETF